MTNDNKHNRPDLLVETEWLAEHLDDPNLRIADMGPIDAYKRAHIPGSMGLNRDYFKDPDNRVLVMGPDRFAEAMSAVGIGDKHDVIAYDDWGGLYAGRLWWLLRMPRPREGAGAERWLEQVDCRGSARRSYTLVSVSQRQAYVSPRACDIFVKPAV